MLSLQKVALVAASALVSINIWTGIPLFALWVGSRVQGSFGSPSMGAVALVVVVLAVFVYAAALALAWLNAKYDAVSGRPAPRRQRYPWLRSLSAERLSEERRELGVSAVERIVVITVVAAALAFEIWFFFFAGSSLPNA
jgi:uncharacterized membrane protein